MSVLDGLTAPIVQAPMAGGPSTPQLAAAVADGGGLGFLAAGYLTAQRLADDMAATRRLTSRAVGVNVFTPGGAPADPAPIAAYAARLDAEARRLGVELGEPRFDDDAFAAKLAVLVDDPVAVVSFTFGAPPVAAVQALHGAGSEVWATVTSADEARAAEACGADVLVVQGVEAGGHRAVFTDDDRQSDLTLLAALQLVAASSRLPLVGAGAVATPGAVAAVLAAGAVAAQVGSAYLRAPEAGTSAVQRAATASDTATVLTRAFSGRIARGIANRLHREHGDGAPHAYPEVHHLTAPLRAAGRERGDGDVVNLWAGQTHALAPDVGAAELTAHLARDARRALADAARRLG